MDPWDTPQTRSAGSDKVESTINLLLVRYDLNQEIVAGGHFDQKIHFW